MQFNSAYEMVLTLSPLALKILLLLLFARKQGQPEITEKILQAHAQKAQNTVRGALLELKRHGLAESREAGKRILWMLPSSAYQLPLIHELWPGAQVIESKFDSILLEATVGAEKPSQILTRSELPEPQSSQILTRSAPEIGKTGQNQAENAMIESKFDSISPPSISSLSSSLTDLNQEKLLLKLEEAKRELAAAGIDDGQIAEFTTRYSPDYLLEKCDYFAFEKHFRRIRKEQSWLTTAIRRGFNPPAYFVPKHERCPDCWQRLNDHAATCPALQPDFGPLRTTEEPSELELPPGDPALVPAPGDPFAAQVWEMALAQVRFSDLSRTNFNTWVAPLHSPQYDRTTGAFRLVAPTPRGRDWVRDYLGATLARLLSGIIGEPVRLDLTT